MLQVQHFNDNVLIVTAPQPLHLLEAARIDQARHRAIFALPRLMLLRLDELWQNVEANLLVLQILHGDFHAHLRFLDGNVLLEQLDHVERLRFDILVGLDRVVRVLHRFFDHGDGIGTICLWIDRLVGDERGDLLER